MRVAMILNGNIDTMKLFECSVCQSRVFFENDRCVNCNSVIGFDPLSLEMTDAGSASGLRYCKNAEVSACNWLIASSASGEYCLSCNLNHIIPNISDPETLAAWQQIEIAKRRLIYSLLKLNLPVAAKKADSEPGIWFEFLQELDDEKILTGHNQGLITLNVNEADSVKREAARNQMEEPYRTLLGHFRHEIGHYYWDVLVPTNTALHNRFRALFGDESLDYGEALQRHYANSDTQSWRSDFVSHYASSHPWEDWAETWAHYLHILAVLESSHYFGLSLRVENSSQLLDYGQLRPYDQTSLQNLIDHWIPIATVLNSLNRSMGHNDFYPFILTPKVIEKLEVVHDAVRGGARW